MAIKLYFFDKCEIYEPIRMILTHGGIDFKDVYIPTNTTIPVALPPEVKANSRWGLVPLVEVEGRTLTQSLAATRYFAKICRLVPDDIYQATLCDEYMDAVRDFTTDFIEIAHIKNPVELKRRFEEMLKLNKALYLDEFESIVKANGGKHLVGEGLSWADICLACTIGNFEIVFGMDLTLDYPNLKNLKECVDSVVKSKMLSREQKPDMVSI